MAHNNMVYESADAVFDKKDLVKIYNGNLKAFVLYGNMIFFIVNFSSGFCLQPLTECV